MIVCHANNRTVSLFYAGTYDSGDRWPIMGKFFIMYKV